MIASVPLYRKAMLRDDLRLKRDALLLKLPLAGGMLQRLILSRFARVLGLLLSSGVPIIRALEITGEVLVNRVYRTFLRTVMEEVAQGGSLSGSLQKSPLFPPLLVHLAGVGEKGGTPGSDAAQGRSGLRAGVQRPPDPPDGFDGAAAGAGHGGGGRHRGPGGAAADIRDESVDKVGFSL